MSTTEEPVEPSVEERLTALEIKTTDLDVRVKALENPPPPPPKPPRETGRKKDWGGNPNPNFWKDKKMKRSSDRKLTWKIVDENDTNVRDLISSQEVAKEIIEYEKSIYAGPTPTPDPTPTPTPNPTPIPSGDKDQLGILKICPDKAGGKTFTNFSLEEKERNYASGAPSEWSCEYTADLGQKLSDIEVTYYIKINGFKDETDNISTKVLGPSHQDGPGRSWYISEVQTDGSDKETLKTETPHPVYFNNHQPVKFQIGQSLVGNWIGIKVITYLINGGKDRYIATYLDTPVADINNPPNNWREYWSVEDKGQLNHAHFIEPTGSLVTSRIDGIKKGDAPTFKFASVREISAPTGGSSPTPEPTPNPTPNPEPSDNTDKFGTKLILSDGSNVRYDYRENFQGGGSSKRWDFICGKTFLNCELTCYVGGIQDVNDEVSGKMRGGKHSDGLHPKTYDMGVGIQDGKTRYRTEDLHPVYKPGADGGIGVPNTGKFIGYKFICNNASDLKAVNLQIWQDAGNNEGDKPANEWKKLADWNATNPLWIVVADDHQETVRIDDDANGSPNLKIKWISLAEIKSS